MMTHKIVCVYNINLSYRKKNSRAQFIWYLLWSKQSSKQNSSNNKKKNTIATEKSNNEILGKSWGANTLRLAQHNYIMKNCKIWMMPTILIRHIVTTKQPPCGGDQENKQTISRPDNVIMCQDTLVIKSFVKTSLQEVSYNIIYFDKRRPGDL